MGELLDFQTFARLISLLMAACTGMIGLLLLSRRPMPLAVHWGGALVAFVLSAITVLNGRLQLEFLLYPVSWLAAALCGQLLLAGCLEVLGRRMPFAVFWGPVALVVGLAFAGTYFLAGDGAALVWAPVMLTCVCLTVGGSVLVLCSGFRGLGLLLLTCAVMRALRLGEQLTGHLLVSADYSSALLLVYALVVLLTGLTLYRATLRYAGLL
jgi:hypothetical protein